jgi:ATP-dependent Clp protease ATP-binding subunit ClpC
VALSGAQGASELKPLVAALLLGQGESGPEVRRYLFGRAARVEDPRTGEATPRIKDVLRGEIDVFIAAWLSRPPADAR